jgi:hypothetical protein
VRFFGALHTIRVDVDVSGAEFEPDGASGCGGIYRTATLGNDDSVDRSETPGGGAGGLHKGSPVTRVRRGRDQFCGFRGTDGFAGAALGEEREDSGFEVAGRAHGAAGGVGVLETVASWECCGIVMSFAVS